MKNRHTTVLLILLLLAPAVRAEVSVQPNGSDLFIKGHQGKVWVPVRHGVPAHFMLNPDGDSRGDIFGDWALNPYTGYPEVAWSRNEGGNYDVVFSWWDGLAWQGPVQISSSPANDLGPRLYHDGNGARYVLWTAWREKGSDAYLARANVAETDFGDPVKMQPEHYSGLLPSGRMTQYSLLTVHEEDHGSRRILRILESLLLEPYYRGTPIDNPFAADMGEVPLGTEPPENEDPTPLGGSPDGDQGLDRSALDPGPDPVLPSQPRIYWEMENLWVDWIEDEDSVGYSVYGIGGFMEPRFVHYHAPADAERARKKVRHLILHPKRR